MKYRLLMTQLLVMISILGSAPSMADSDNPRDGGYFDIGLGLVAQSDPFTYDDSSDSGLALFVNARYQKYGFFVEFPHGSSNQQNTVISLGYNFLNTEHWTFDLQLAMNHRDLTHEYEYNGRLIEDRRVSHSQLGLRVAGYFDKNEVLFNLASASGQGGTYASAWYTRTHQYHNWNFYLSAGAQYRDAQVVDYFYGVSPYQVTAELPAYTGQSGVEFTAQAGVSYPLTTNWVFESYLRTTFLPSGISDSPFVDGNKITESAVLIKYVF